MKLSKVKERELRSKIQNVMKNCNINYSEQLQQYYSKDIYINYSINALMDVVNQVLDEPEEEKKKWRRWQLGSASNNTYLIMETGKDAETIVRGIYIKKNAEDLRDIHNLLPDIIKALRSAHTKLYDVKKKSIFIDDLIKQLEELGVT